MTFRPSGQHPLPAAYALPAGCTALLGVGALAAGTDGHVGSAAVLVLTAMIVAGTSFVAEARAAPLLAVVGWLTVAGFSHAPYAELNPGGPHALRNGLVIVLVALAGAGAGVGWRGAWRAGRSPEASRSILMSLENQRLPSTLEIVDRLGAPLLPATPASVAQSSRRKVIRRTPAEPSWFGKATGVGRRRQVAGLTLAFVALPLLTAGLVQVREELPLVDDLLLYLATLVGITVVGGFWPAVTAAVAASLLLNWFFTPPIHTWTIEQPQNLLALLLFITVAVSVSSTVHAAAQRAREAARASAESAALLDLARTVLSGEDTPRAVLGHLTAVLHLPAELEERTATGWIRVASSAESFRVGPAVPGAAAVLQARDDVRLVVAGDATSVPRRVLEGFAAQAAAALDRDRLRVQAAQAEALAEGNRMRTALLAAVSHDLRTPLASVKASVSSLRQTDVAYTPEDQRDLLATIDQGADRLDALIGNLLDMSRLQTGALQPFLRPTVLDEVVPVALHSVDHGSDVVLELPEDLPLVQTDPGLLERALANLLDNAVRYSPLRQPPLVGAVTEADRVVISVVDHGPGVPRDARQEMFAPFQRLGDRTAGTGIGLGLAVAKGFIEGMGGQIAAHDTPGGGLTMRISLPAAPLRTRGDRLRS